MKRNVSQSGYQFLKQEFTHLEEASKLPPGTAIELMDYYQVQAPTAKVPPASKINPIQVLLIIGSVLIGLSILSFVASNWSELSKTAKYLILFLTLIAFYLGGKFSETRKPELSKTLFYIGAFAYGGEIFYIGQLFHLGGHWEDAFLMWGLGILPLAFYLKDTVIKTASLLFIYLFIEVKFIMADDWLVYFSFAVIPLMFALSYFFFREFRAMLMAFNFFLLYQFIELQFAVKPMEYEQVPYVFVLLLPVLFYIGHKIMKKSKPLFLLNLVLTLQLFVMLMFTYQQVNMVAVDLLFFFAIGVGFVYFQPPAYRLEMKLTGMVLHFITAFTLTFGDVWAYDEWLNIGDDKAWIYALGFSTLYFIYALTLINKENLFGVAIVCIWIFRFYVDLSLAFMNKSIAFLVGGILLIGLGYWFERTRKKEAKKRADHVNEK